MSDSQQVTELSSEQRVKAAVPDAELYCDVAGNGAYSVGSPSLRVTIGAQSWSKQGAWDNALHHPPVVAYEAQHRPKAVAQPKVCVACEGNPTHPNDPCAVCGKTSPVVTRALTGEAEPVAQSEGRDRDWPEDAPHDNGSYNCKCWTCGEMFIGHKRRVQCKLCAAKPVPPASGFEEWWKEYSPIRTMGETNYLAVAWAAWSAALSTHPPAPVDAKVTWRVDWRNIGDKGWAFYSEYGVRPDLDNLIAIAGIGEERRLVATTEEVIETRKKEA